MPPAETHRLVLHMCLFTSWYIYSRLCYENVTNNNRSDYVWQLNNCFTLKPSLVPLWDSTTLNYPKCLLVINLPLNATILLHSLCGFQAKFWNRSFLSSTYFSRLFRQLLWLAHANVYQILRTDNMVQAKCKTSYLERSCRLPLLLLDRKSTGENRKNRGGIHCHKQQLVLISEGRFFFQNSRLTNNKISIAFLTIQVSYMTPY